MKRVVIIGGGITGLAAAHRVLERHHEAGQQVDLTLLEAGDRLGGIVQTKERDGFLLERGPDSFISEKPAALELVKRLGLESQLIETNEKHRRSFIVRQGRLLPVPEGFQLLAPSRFWPFVKSDIFSWTGKARMALDLVLPRRHPSGEPQDNPHLAPNGSGNSSEQAGAALSDESLAQFVRRRLGREALERMAQPMVGGIFTADPERLSLRATMPRFLEMEREHGSLIRALRSQGKKAKADVSASGSAGQAASAHEVSGARYSLFLSFAAGMQTLTDKLAERISDLKFEISNLKPQNQDLESQNSELKSDSDHTAQVLRQNADRTAQDLRQNSHRTAQDLRSEISNLKSQTSETDPANSDAIRLNTPVESLNLEHPNGSSSRWHVKISPDETIIADAVCLALPSYVSASLLRTVDPELATELDGIPYASSATINLAYRREDIPHGLDGFGFVVPFIEGRAIIACSFSSMKFSGRAPEGKVLLRAFMGGALQPEMFELNEEGLISLACMDLRDLLGIKQAPLFAEVSKWARSMPQYHVGHLERVKRIEERIDSLPGLALAGNAYTGLGIPDCIRSGEAAADSLFRVR